MLTLFYYKKGVLHEKIKTDKKFKNPYIIATLIFLVIDIIIIDVKMFMQRKGSDRLYTQS